MTFLQNILRILDSQMAKPTLYGWFHILWLVITVGLSIGLCYWHRRKGETPVRKVLLWTAIVVMALELYKQINYSFSYEGGISFDFQWYAFPFQFCSTPMYICLLAALTPKGKIHDAACAYLATFAVFAGICVMIYPGDVFIKTTGINIQTMICHGSMIWVGVYLYGSGHVKAQPRTILKAVPVFAICAGLAMVMNEIAYFSGLLKRETFNMFFISPHCEPSLPVYSLVQEAVPFPFCLIIYLVMFSVAAFLILLLATLFTRRAGKAAAQPVV